jgi:hypothetical protein
MRASAAVIRTSNRGNWRRSTRRRRGRVLWDAELRGGFPEVQNGAAHIVFGGPKVADLILDEMNRIDGSDTRGLDGKFGFQVFNGRGNGRVWRALHRARDVRRAIILLRIWAGRSQDASVRRVS